jgi:hypothetical protein
VLNKENFREIAVSMKKYIFALVLFSSLVWTVLFVQAAPAPRGIALNHEARECAGFWPGDEFVAYALPDHWKPYFPEYNRKTGISTLVTERGECDFNRKGDVENCCKTLGYKYVSDNIGKDKKTVLRDREEFLKGMRGPNSK